MSEHVVFGSCTILQLKFIEETWRANVQLYNRISLLEMAGKNVFGRLVVVVVPFSEETRRSIYISQKNKKHKF